MDKNGTKTNIKRQKRTETDRNGPTWKKMERSDQKQTETEKNRKKQAKQTKTDRNELKHTELHKNALKRTETHRNAQKQTEMLVMVLVFQTVGRNDLSCQDQLEVFQGSSLF